MTNARRNVGPRRQRFPSARDNSYYTISLLSAGEKLPPLLRWGCRQNRTLQRTRLRQPQGSKACLGGAQGLATRFGGTGVPRSLGALA
jgi:hypothetical protein